MSSARNHAKRSHRSQRDHYKCAANIYHGCNKAPKKSFLSKLIEKLFNKNK